MFFRFDGGIYHRRKKQVLQCVFVRKILYNVKFFIM